MESATLRLAPPPPRPIQVGLVTLLVVAAAGAWAVTGERMDGMDAGPGTELGGLGWFTVVWVTMMAAMMLPPIAPMVLAYARMGDGGRGRVGAAGAAATVAFVGGYLLAWGVAGVVGYAIVEGVRELDLGFLGWDAAGPYVAGGVILGAAAYQLTRPKGMSLRRCRDPRELLLERWHPGASGAMRMGIEHGGFCIGCCWAMMAALFALGVMSVGWMAFIAALIAVEKLLPWRALATRGIAIVLAALAVAVAFAPEDVPGLTVPGSPEAHQAMEAMGMEGEGGAMGMEGERGAIGMEHEGGAMEMEGEGGAVGDAMDSAGEGMDRGSMASASDSMEK
jgi:predicted metal-binding membrane protein